MESRICDHSTPSKRPGRSEQFGHSTLNPDRLSRLIHNYQTPPSKPRINNPFEAIIQEKYHTHFSSPSVFANVPETKAERFIGIDLISQVYPADIDEQSIDQFETPEQDSAIESFAQSRIDKYFSMKEIIPSPFSVQVQSPLIKETAVQSPVQVEKCDNMAQTVLTLPPILPDHVEEILKPYFSYTQNQQDSKFNVSIYRRLFEYEESSQHSSPTKSHNSLLSPVQFSPYRQSAAIEGRSMCTPKEDILKECALSPIIKTPENEARGTKLNFSSHMSVDLSFGVPDVNDMPAENKSLNSTQSPIKQVLSDSTINWDLEYKHIASPQSINCYDEMDVSNSNTPKSKIFSSQRKKLSDSFRDDSNLSQEELVIDTNMMNSDERLYMNDLTDAGYQTGLVMSEDSLWSSSRLLIASTPTKNKIN